jgi:glutaredoxin-like protein
MNFLDEEMKTKLREVFQALEKPISLVLFEDIPDCDYCSDTMDLLNDLTKLTPQIHLIHYDIKLETEKAKCYGADLTPFISVAKGAVEEPLDVGVHFAGIPVGHEFSAFISSILMVSRGKSNLSLETKDFLKTLEHPIDLQVFSTPTCPYCPRAISLAHQMALESSLVTATAVEALEFPELSEKYNVSGVPHTSVNFGAGRILGAIPEEKFLEEIRKIAAS